ncbi:MAG: hypothetical protein WBA12_15235 [Catalinimonas sp.]
MKRLLLLLLLPLALGCTTDFDVNADWREITVMYGLFDPDDSVHYVRVNKAFLNDEQDALQLAQLSDSLEYQQEIEVKLWEIVGNAERREIATLVPTTITNKDTGTFYYPEQIVYRTPAANTPLTPGVSYEVEVRNLETGHVATARTDVALLFDIKSPAQQLILPVAPVSIERGVEVRVTPSANTKTHQISLVSVPYVEYYTDNDSAQRSLDIPVSFLLIGSGEVSRTLPEGFIFEEIGARLDRSNNDRVVGRKFQFIRITCTGANGDVERYIAVNNNFSPLTQTKPFFSNVTNGVGLIGSRVDLTVRPTVDVRSINALAETYPDLKVVR